MNETNKSGQGTQYTTSSGRRQAKEEQDRLEKEQRDKKGGLNNVTNLIQEAFDDADCRSPVFFLMTHSVNVLDLLTEFH